MISIIISTRNHENYIAEAIESILYQTNNNYELIIVNDGSTDNSQKIIDSYCTQPSNMKIREYRTDDIGLSKTRNFGAMLVTGKYLLFMDGDDKLDKTFLKKTSKILDDFPDIGFCYSDTQHFDGANSYWEQPEYSFYNLLRNNYICSCSLIRREAFESVRGFDENNFGYWEDYEFWISIGAKGYYGRHTAEKLFYYRIHKDSGMQSERNKKLSNVYHMYIISKFPQLYPIDWVMAAKEVLATYPDDFMKRKPFEHEQYIKDHNL